MRNTHISIKGEQFYINNRPTYQGVSWQGHRIEGLLLNSRMVQGIFDDLNPKTQHQWAYADTGTWDAQRNTQEFIEAMPSWYEHGVLAFTLNLQGGSPYGYSKEQPWINSGFTPDGSLDPHYLLRLKQILDKADELGMIVILGLFYFGQDDYLEDEIAVKSAVINTVNWLKTETYRHVLLEINNECDVSAYDHKILMPQRVHELITLAKETDPELLMSTSFRGRSVPTDQTVAVADFLLLHGDGIGPEVVRAAVHVLQVISDASDDVSLNFNSYPGGAGHYRDTGVVLDNAVFEACKASDAILFGAAGYYDVRMPDGTDLSAKLMLEWLADRHPAVAQSLGRGARAIDEAVTGLLKDSDSKTPDLGGNAGTTDVAEAIANHVANTLRYAA